MKVSFTDQWQVLFDENGKPLVGRVKFMKADASQFKPVYYEDEHGDEVLAPNPCYTLQDGRLEHQIFLDYGVYTCIVEKFNGVDSSNMSDYANDDDYWTLVKSFKIDGCEEPQQLSNDLMRGIVGTIDELRDVDPTYNSVVRVVGYYSKDDDIEPRTYVWQSGDQRNENFGSVILSNIDEYTNTGRWILCESPTLCATTFGVFPDRQSTLDASELSLKASNLAVFASTSLCEEIFFEEGHYYFSAGTSLSFNKKVITNATSQNPIKFDMDGIQDLGEGETLVGSVAINFFGGLDTRQENSILDNGDYITFAFGEGTIKTSWIDKSLYKHIDASSTFKNITCILDKSASLAFCSSNKSFERWFFVGSNVPSHLSVPNQVGFSDCLFEGKCFGSLGQNCAFVNCGDIYQECVTSSALNSNVIWLNDGTIKSTGTKFWINNLSVTQDFTNPANNSCISPFGEDPKIVSNRASTTFMFFDNGFTLYGKIGFEDKDTLYANMYHLFNNCVSYALLFNKKIDLLKGAYSYEIDTTDISNPRTFVFENGAITLTKTGSGTVKDIVNLDNIVALFDNSISNIKVVAKDCVISGINNTIIDFESYGSTITADSGKSIVVKEGKFSDTILNGNVRLLPNSSNVVAQEFYGCKFDKPVTIYSSDSTVTSCCVKIVSCTFIIDNNGTKINAIYPFEQDGGSWANDENNSFVIENSVCLMDAYILPTKRYNAIIDDYTGTARTTPTNDGSVYSNGTEYKTKGLYGVSTTDLNNMDFFKNRFLHFGDINILINAFTQTTVELMTYPIVDIESQVKVLTTSFSVEKV